jgi:hypothetical protein
MYVPGKTFVSAGPGEHLKMQKPGLATEGTAESRDEEATGHR